MNSRAILLWLAVFIPIVACFSPVSIPDPISSSLLTSTAELATGTPMPAPTVLPMELENRDGLGIELVGPPEFIEQARAALDMLASCDPEALAIADRQLTAIVHSDRSGMDVASASFLASDTTAFAPNYPPAAQVFWFAGSIVHDARHRWQSENGVTENWDQMSIEDRQDIEHDARGVQIAALENCLSEIPAESLPQAEGMLNYLTGMQSGEILCDYCEVEWAERDW